VPELPEVETIRSDLEPLVVGRAITAVEVDPATLPLLAGAGVSREALAGALVGRRITSLGRRGKYLLFGLHDGSTLIVHLRMTGRLLWRDAVEPEERFERARITLDDGHHLRWSDVRKFGTWRVVESTEALLASLGPEPIDGTLTFDRFSGLISGRRAAIKAVLLDQRRIAGLGNIYVDEALFEARIRPDTPAADISAAAQRRLHSACRAVLERGIENRGASFRDYVDARGDQGRQHMYVQVFRRHGQPCYACGTEIVRTVVGGRSTHYCPNCQPRPRRKRFPTDGGQRA
jgi:formamidopyrimidine-DNA glycosylase